MESYISDYKNIGIPEHEEEESYGPESEED